MKKIITVLLFSLINYCSNAHNINYEKVILKQWTIEKENKSVEGSFCMFKNETVFIETSTGILIKIPFTALSKEDQTFVLKKIESVSEINSQKHSTKNHSGLLERVFNYQLCAVLVLLFGLIWFVFSIKEKRKLKYLIPILIVGVSYTLFSFTNKVINAMQTTTSPAFIDSAFVPFKPSIHTYWDTSYFYVESKGIPTTHTMMVGISNHGWQQQVPIPQCYIGANAWPIPLNPVFASNPIPVDSIHFTRGAIALAINGIPIFNVHTNTGVDSYLDGQLDNYGGHCGRADDYHYHIAPLHLYNYTTTNLPIAFGLDGFAVYGSVEPDGTPMQLLDTNHGHLFNGNYHYHGTVAAPYMIARMAGQVTEDLTHQLIPQAAAHPVRPGLTPLNGALITSCTPNSANNGYNLTYTKNGLTDSVIYSWTSNGHYTFKFYTNGNLDSTKNYNSFVQCNVPLASGIVESSIPESNVIISPNPNNGNFYLHLSSNLQPGNVQLISIYNVQGNLVYQSNNFQHYVEMSGLPKGVYLVHILFSKNQITQKIILQ